MNNKGIKYSFVAPVWKYNGAGGWCFVSLPLNLSAEIRENLKWQEEGWGRLKAWAVINNHEWKTAIWFDTRHKTYLLPVKAEVRKKLKIKEGDPIEVTVFV